VVKALSGISPDDQTFLSSSMAFKTAPERSDTCLDWASTESMKAMAEANVSLVHANASSGRLFKTFYGRNYRMGLYKPEFVHCEPFHSSIMFESKAHNHRVITMVNYNCKTFIILTTDSNLLGT
jgi:hypothetical protein